MLDIAWIVQRALYAASNIRKIYNREIFAVIFLRGGILSRKEEGREEGGGMREIGREGGMKESNE